MIQIRNLWKRFGANTVLRGLNLENRDGEILVILGRSGAGKSVLLRHIMGIEQADEGEILIDSRVSKSIGMLFQGSALFDSMNIGDNTAFYLRQHGDPRTGEFLPESEIERRVQLALEQVGLEGVEKKLPSDLSGGMRKRAGLARLIVYSPMIRLFDEPTTGLDPISGQQINDLIVKIQHELNGSSLVVTHDIRAAFQIADRIALHKEGRIAHVAPPNEFIKVDDPLIQFFREHL